MVVARAVQFDFARFGRVPVAGPARAEELPGQVGVVVQEVEGDRGADVVEERCAVEGDSGEYLPADACPVRRAGAEEQQERGEPGGHADGAPGQAAKPFPVEPRKTKSYGHGSSDGNRFLIGIRQDTAYSKQSPESELSGKGQPAGCETLRAFAGETNAGEQDFSMRKIRDVLRRVRDSPERANGARVAVLHEPHVVRRAKFFRRRGN